MNPVKRKDGRYYFEDLSPDFRYKSRFPVCIVALIDRRVAICNEFWLVVNDDIKLSDVRKHLIYIAPKTTVIKKKNETFIIPNSKGTGTYKVILNNGNLTCSCPGFGFRRSCRHIKEIKEQLK